MHVVVVGGGIAGLSAAHDLVEWPDVAVTVLDAAPGIGGKLQTLPFAGLPVDLAADAFLARRPEAVQLCRELGIDGELVPPATGAASLWVGGRLRPLPDGTLLGVPTDVRSVARSGVLTPLGLARLAVEPLLPGEPLGPDDTTVGAVVRRRLGREAHERLVDPLVGGINAGDTRELSIDAVAPGIAAAARRDRSLLRGARDVRNEAPATDGPVFLGFPGGMGRLVDALVERLEAAGAQLRTNARVGAVDRRIGGGYRVATDRGPIDADAVVVAVPAPAAARLIAPLAPEVGATLAGIEHASVAIVALAWPAAAVPGPLAGSGFLVPRSEGRLMTACSWASSKWAHLGGTGSVVLRASAGRAGDTRAEGMSDDELVARLVVELRAAMGVQGDPSEVRVTRWPGGFPQYRPGHLARMAAARVALAEAAPGIALAGAALGGVGVPACIASGRAAAAALRP